MEKKSTIHGTSVSYEDSMHKNNSRENMYTRHKRSTFIVNKDRAHQQHMYYYDLSIFMINKDGSFSTNICLIMAFPELFPISIPSESKRTKNMLEPTMRVANKLTPEPKSKMAENTPEHPGREQNS